MSEQKLSEKCAEVARAWFTSSASTKLDERIAIATGCDTLAQQLADSRKECGELVEAVRSVLDFAELDASSPSEVKAIERLNELLSKHQGKEGEK